MLVLEGLRVTVENPSAYYIEITSTGAIIRERVDLSPPHPGGVVMNQKITGFMKEQTVEQRTCAPPCEPK